jgi:hypothetical protein
MPAFTIWVGGPLTAVGREYVREYRSSFVEITSDFNLIRRTSARKIPGRSNGYVQGMAASAPDDSTTNTLLLPNSLP